MDYSAAEMKTRPCIVRCPANPILTCEQVPYPSERTSNAGVVKFQGKYVMVFRNSYTDETSALGSFKTCIGLAFSDDGISWSVQPKPCFVLETDEISRAYDPRLTVIDGRCYMCFAADGRKGGVRGGIAVTDDFERFEVLSLSAPDNRNMVLFPEKIQGKYFRLERPFSSYGHAFAEDFECWTAASPDMKYWGEHHRLLGVEQVPFVNRKVGPSAPPIKTTKGWLCTFHGVEQTERKLDAWHGEWNKIYHCGLMLLALDNPTKIIGMCPYPLIVAEMEYEIHGFRGEVIFPGGMILEDNGQVKIYYGASDTTECLAIADVDDLLALCAPWPR